MLRVAILLLCLVGVTTHAWAFPDNGVLDTFTGSDGTTPPSSNWTNAVFVGASSGNVVIQDNAVSNSSNSVDADAYWNVSTFGAGCEAYATIVDTADGRFYSVYCRLVNIGVGTTDGYQVEVDDAGSGISIFRIDNAATTQLGATVTQTITTTDKFGIKTVGDQICLWFNDSGAGWTELTCRTDATYSAGGSIGLSANSTTTLIGMMDDFGGGTVAAASTSHNMMLMGVGQ